MGSDSTSLEQLFHFEICLRYDRQLTTQRDDIGRVNMYCLSSQYCQQLSLIRHYHDRQHRDETSVVDSESHFKLLQTVNSINYIWRL